MPTKKLIVKIKKLTPKARLPIKADSSSAGWDIYSTNDTRINIPSQARAVIETGIAMEIPDGYYAKIEDRSGLALRSSLTVVAGVIDSSYRGEIKVVLANYSDLPISLELNNAIAQFTILPVPDVKIEEVTELSETTRGSRGFGSTNKA
jgi:deoxyuridine 5'-triphosphate nucleotidohydrolase